MLDLQRALCFAAKVREYPSLTDIDPKLMGEIVKGAEDSDEPQQMLNEQGLKELEDYLETLQGKRWIMNGVKKVMNDKEWVKETQRRAGLVATYFKPKENMVIQDFIVTATNIEKED